MPPGDDEANPFGGGITGRMGGRRRRNTSNTWATGGLNFDTKGVEKFTSEIKKAEQAIGKFVNHFERLERALKGMDPKKLEALGQVGTGGGGGGGYSNGGDVTFGGQKQPQLIGANGQPLDAGVGAQGGMGWWARMRQQMTGVVSSGGHIDAAARLMFIERAAQTAGAVGGRLNNYYSSRSEGWGHFDLAARFGASTSGLGPGGYRQMYNFGHMARGDNGANVFGHLGQGDLNQAMFTALSMRGGMAGNLSNSHLNALDPTMGAAGAMSMRRAMMDPRLINRLTPFGGGLITRGGGMRSESDMLRHLANIATGGRGDSLSASQAHHSFAYGAKGWSALSSVGVDENMIELVRRFKVAEATAGRPLDLKNKDDRHLITGGESLFESQIEMLQAKTSRDSKVLRETEETQRDYNDAVRNATLKTSEFAAELQKVGFVLGKIGGPLSSLADMGVLAMAFNTLSGRSLAKRGGNALATGVGKVAGKLGASGVDANSIGKSVLRTGAKRLGIAGMAYGAFDAARDVVNDGNKFDDAWRGLRDTVQKFGNGVDEAGIGDPVNGGGIDLPGPGREQGLNPGFHQKLAALFSAAPFKLTLTSGFRTRAEQEDLYRRKPHLAAKPGRSKHEKGFAADLGENNRSLSSAAAAWLRQNAPNFGLKVPMPGKEPWHVEDGQGGSSASSDTAGSRGADSGGNRGGRGGFSYRSFSGLNASAGSILQDLLGGPSYKASFAKRRSDDGGGAGPGSNGNGREDLLGILRGAGFQGESLRMAYAVMMAESSGDPRAFNGNRGTGDQSYGLFQINMLGGMGPERRRQYGLSSNEDLLDPKVNARVAFQMSKGGTNWSPWSTYKRREHQKFYDPGIGDPVSGGGDSEGSRPMSVSSSRSVTVQNLHLNIKIDKVSEEEAMRLAKMTVRYISENDRLERLGTH